MLETLLSHFHSYGMNDLEFIIVNSKLSHSQLRLGELEKRVSFKVYQETDEEEVWSIMEGGKDDMFIYDRCGRLTYFVPFPLSILNEYPLVSNAILATYFRSPCGVTCEKNGTVELGEIAQNIETYTENESTVTQDGVFYNETEGPVFDINATEDSSSNDLLGALYTEINVTALNLTDSVAVTDYDYNFTNDSANKNETNSKTVDESKSYFNTLYSLFFNAGRKNKTDETYGRNNTFNETIKNDTFLQFENNITDNNTMHLHNHQQHKLEKDNRKPKKSDRCVEADYEVCKSWSKKRLLHAQKCCSSGPQNEFDDETQISCHHFGKRRCKKIQSILKCCIKTSITEAVTTSESDATTKPEATTDPPLRPTDVADAVCCMISDSGKFCRVSETGICKEDESVEDSPNQVK